MATRNLRKPLEMMIDYEDAGGDASRRKISVEAVEETGGKIYLLAWCRLYDAPRTFRADRIVSLIDEMGNVRPPSEAVDRVMAILDGQKRGPRRKAATLKEPHTTPAPAMDEAEARMQSRHIPEAGAAPPSLGPVRPPDSSKATKTALRIAWVLSAAIIALMIYTGTR